MAAVCLDILLHVLEIKIAVRLKQFGVENGLVQRFQVDFDRF